MLRRKNKISQILSKGALIGYGKHFGTLPHIVTFQFNPESITRSIRFPYSYAWKKPVADQTIGPPEESISFTAHLDASDQLNKNNIIIRKFGIGPQIAALERMLYPLDTITGAIGGLLDKTGIPGKISKDIDSVGSQVLPKKEENGDNPTPRLLYPKILFFWGVKRILPVKLSDITITEKQFDGSLNPTRAEVRIGLTVNKDLADTDVIAWGAYKLTMLAKEAQALLNVASKIDLPPELATVIPF